MKEREVMKDLVRKLNLVLVKDRIGMAIKILNALSAVSDTLKFANTSRFV